MIIRTAWAVVGGTKGGGLLFPTPLMTAPLAVAGSGGDREWWMMEADVPAGWWDRDVLGGGWTEVDGEGRSKWVGWESRYI